MKGLLSGMNKSPGALAIRQGIHHGIRKKVRKSREQVGKYLHSNVKEEGEEAQITDVGIVGKAQIAEVGIKGDVGITEIGIEGDVQVEIDVSKGEESEERLLEHRMEIQIVYDGDKATVTLLSKQVVAMDGCAFVRLLKGRAAVDGYFLSPGVDLLLCSNAKLSAVVTIESPPSGALEFNVHPSASCLDLQTSSLKVQAHGIESLGCSLEFRSGSCVDTSKQPTFRLITGEHGTDAGHEDIRKSRKNRADVHQISKDREEDEDEEDVDVRRYNNYVRVEKAWPNVDGLMDIEGDELSEPSNLSTTLNTKETWAELRTPIQPTVIPDSWWTAVNSILQHCEADCTSKESGMPHQSCEAAKNRRSPIVVVCGAKNVGKSTFARFLLNFLLNRHEAVGYLDTDVGQPEFTVPGCLSLHIVRLPVFGSPVLHLRNPEKSFYYGDVSPKVDPEMYSRSVVSLFDYFQQTYCHNEVTTKEDDGGFSAIPLVINTHGWIKGIGYDVLVDMLCHTSPTHVVQFNSSAENKKLPAGRFWESSSDCDQTKMLYIDSALEASNGPVVKVKMASDHLRTSRIMAYFRQCFSRTPLPYPYREEKIFAQMAFSLVHHRPYQVPKAESLHSINASMVGLGISSITTDNNVLLSSYQYPSCVGLGIVRGVDAEKGVLYIITPLPFNILQKVDTLLQGRVPIPVPLLQKLGECLACAKSPGYLQADKTDFTSEVLKDRSNPEEMNRSWAVALARTDSDVLSIMLKTRE